MTITKPRPFVFVLMPFAKEYNDLYEYGIRQACEAAGAYCERVDEQIFQGSMLARVINQISKADVIVALMTGRNPNVFYETGYAHALGKTTILLTKDEADIPFDLKDKPHILYGDAIKTLNEKLEKHVRHFLEHPEAPHVAPSSRIELYSSGKLLTDGSIFDVTSYKKVLNLHIDLHNPTDSVVPAGKVKVCVSCSEMIQESTKERFSTALPSGHHMVDLPPIPQLLPQSWTQLRFQLYRPKADEFKTGDQLGLTFLLYTEAGVSTVSTVAFVNVLKPRGAGFSFHVEPDSP